MVLDDSLVSPSCLLTTRTGHVVHVSALTLFCSSDSWLKARENLLEHCLRALNIFADPEGNIEGNPVPCCCCQAYEVALWLSEECLGFSSHSKLEIGSTSNGLIAPHYMDTYRSYFVQGSQDSTQQWPLLKHQLLTRTAKAVVQLQSHTLAGKKRLCITS